MSEFVQAKTRIGTTRRRAAAGHGFVSPPSPIRSQMMPDELDREPEWDGRWLGDLRAAATSVQEAGERVFG